MLRSQLLCKPGSKVHRFMNEAVFEEALCEKRDEFVLAAFLFCGVCNLAARRLRCEGKAPRLRFRTPKTPNDTALCRRTNSDLVYDHMHTTKKNDVGAQSVSSNPKSLFLH